MPRDRKGIPRKVLTGKEPRYIKVANLYKARMAQEVMRRVNASFWTRARGEQDRVAGTWTPLKRSTIAYKKLLTPLNEQGVIKDWYALVSDASPQEGMSIASDEFNRSFKRTFTTGQLSPEDQVHFNKLVKSILDKDTKGGAARLARAKKEAWKQWQEERSFAKLINIRTGRLVAATAPGTVTNNRYYPPTDQTVTISYTSVRISIAKVPYAKSVDMVRKIIPDNIQVWVDEAHEIVMPEVLALYNDLKQSIPPKKRKKRRKSSPTLRNRGYSDDVPF